MAPNCTQEYAICFALHQRDRSANCLVLDSLRARRLLGCANMLAPASCMGVTAHGGPIVLRSLPDLEAIRWPPVVPRLYHD